MLSMRRCVLFLLICYLAVSCFASCKKKEASQSGDTLDTPNAQSNGLNAEPSAKEQTEPLAKEQTDPFAKEQTEPSETKQTETKDDNTDEQVTGDIDKVMSDLLKTNRLELKHSDVKWESIESDYPLPILKISTEKDIADELSTISHKPCTQLADTKVSDGTYIQVFECAPDEDTIYQYFESSIDCDPDSRDFREHPQPTELAKQCAKQRETKIIEMYIGFVAPNEKKSRVYKVHSDHENLEEWTERGGGDCEITPSFELKDVQSFSWLDTTAYSIRINGIDHKCYDHACDSPMCNIDYSYYHLHTHVFAGKKYRPVGDWLEIYLSETEDGMVCEYLYNKSEEECEGLNDDAYEKCRYQLDKDGDRMIDETTGCPSREMNAISCQKAVLDGKKWSVSEVDCK